MSLKQLFGYGMCFLMTISLSGCLYAAAAGAGAYGGYKAKEKGYTVQNPVTKETPRKDEQQAAAK